jgi:hypothetical protein
MAQPRAPENDYFPYVPQSGPDFVPLNSDKLPFSVWLLFGSVFLIMAMAFVVIVSL